MSKDISVVYVPFSLNEMSCSMHIWIPSCETQPLSSRIREVLSSAKSHPDAVMDVNCHVPIIESLSVLSPHEVTQRIAIARKIN